MNFEPQKFFIGLMDFFSVLLPGALLTALFVFRAGTGPLKSICDEKIALDETTRWLVFLFSSYLLGHFIFLIGAFALDDHVYDRLRSATSRQHFRRLAKGKKLRTRFERRLAKNLFKPVSDLAVAQAATIKARYLGPLRAASAVNAFQWCKARLTLEHPEAAAEVQRFEANSKFFRSLIVVLVVLFCWESLRCNVWIPVLCLFLLALASWRYIDQRNKATNQAYWYIIALEGAKDPAARPASPKGDGPTHAGGVVYKKAGGHVEYLLVQASDNSDLWVLPKGHIEPGEQPAETAVREVREESGVWASKRAKLKVDRFTKPAEEVIVQYYLMEFLEQEPTSEQRELKWLPLTEAIDKASHPGVKELLALAEKTRLKL